ncbi:uncharacterized protein FRV6_01007 [Fusarium oxysporum]|uniref:Uncharacterized protein n=1 Tax=Fusarium oxysporum TaxID=5507 RepID=A0A2H3STT5_FUSOX|nr:uncharacterized protein FRV6_01007 [Fusarium oxysporum]
MTLVEAFDRGEARLARRILRVVQVILEEVLQHQHPAAPQEAGQKAEAADGLIKRSDIAIDIAINIAIDIAIEIGI